MQGFVDQVIASGWPAGASAPKDMVPPPDPGPQSINELIAALQELETGAPHRVNAYLFGPIETSKFRRFALIHAAHHLSHFDQT